VTLISRPRDRLFKLAKVTGLKLQGDGKKGKRVDALAKSSGKMAEKGVKNVKSKQGQWKASLPTPKG
jgi:hypothetical protein